MLDVRIPTYPTYAHHVESCVPTMQSLFRKEVQGDSSHLLLFLMTDSLERTSELLPGPGPDFNKDDDSLVERDEIDLSQKTPVVSADDAITKVLEKLHCERLGFFSKVFSRSGQGYSLHGNGRTASPRSEKKSRQTVMPVILRLLMFAIRRK